MGTRKRTGEVIVVCALLSVCGALSLCASTLAGWSPFDQWFAALVLLGIGVNLLAGVGGIVYAIYRALTKQPVQESYPVPVNIVPFYPPKMVKPEPVYRHTWEPVYVGGKQVAGYMNEAGQIVWGKSKPAN